MSWIVDGNSEELSISISELGCYAITGTALVHDLRPATFQPDQLEEIERINAAKCVWSIHSTANADDATFSLASFDQSFLERVRAKPDQSVAAISFYTEPDVVGISVALPEKTFTMAMNLFEVVLNSESIGYRFVLEMLGFGFPISGLCPVKCVTLDRPPGSPDRVGQATCSSWSGASASWV